jgi:hypothetical protein
LPDERIVAACTTYTPSANEEEISQEESSQEEEDNQYHTRAQVMEPPPQGSPSGASWQWRALPEMGDAHRYGTVECVLSDDRRLRSLWRL